MRSIFRTLLLLCSDDKSREPLTFPFVEGDFVYATDGKIILRCPLNGMGRIPAEYGTGIAFPSGVEAVYPNRPDAEFRRLHDLSLPRFDDSSKPHGVATVHACRIGDILISAKYLNILVQFNAEVEINAPSKGMVLLWRISTPHGMLEGALMGVRAGESPDFWVWDIVNGGYKNVIRDPENSERFLIVK